MKYLNKRHSRIVVFAVIVFLAFVAAMSVFGFSNDYRNYENLYHDIARNSPSNEAGSLDYIFLLTASIFGRFDLPFASYVFLFSIVSMGIKFGVLLERFNKNNLIWIFILLYLTQLYWLHEYTQIRVSLALAFMLWAIYISSEKFKLVIFALGIMSHASVVVVPMVYYASRLMSTRILLASAIGLAGAFTFASPFLVEYILNGFNGINIPFYNKLSDYAFYVVNEDLLPLNIFSPTPALQLVTVLFSARRVLANNPTSRVEIILSIIGPLLFYSLSPIPIVATRFYELFIIFYLVYIARYWSVLGWARVLILPYIFLSLRAAFFSSDPIVNFYS